MPSPPSSGFMTGAGVLLALLALGAGASGAAPDAPAWGRADHERLATTILERLGAEVRSDCPAQPAFVDHFGTPVCGYVALDFEAVAERLLAEAAGLDDVEVRRVHASQVEAYVDLRVRGRQHLVDFVRRPNAAGEHLLLWFLPDLPGPSPPEGPLR